MKTIQDVMRTCMLLVCIYECMYIHVEGNRSGQLEIISLEKQKKQKCYVEVEEGRSTQKYNVQSQLIVDHVLYRPVPVVVQD